MKELLAHRELLKTLIATDLKLEHREKWLGRVWSVVDPLLLMLVYLFIVGFVFKVREPSFPLFLFVGLLVWRFFAGSVQEATRSLGQYASMMRQAYFPRAVIPVTVLASNSVAFGFGLVAFFILMFALGVTPKATVLWLPALVALQALLILGFAFLFSYLGAFFKDMTNLVSVGVRFGFYLSPVLYAVTRVPERYKAVYLANPFASLIPAYRDVLVYGKNPEALPLLYVLGVAVVVLLVGYWLFRRHESEFVKVL